MKIFFKTSYQLHKTLIKLVFSNPFIIITLIGNIIIIGFSFIFYLLESSINNSINSFLDALWWGFATATTVGYGDIIPVTAAGKIVGIALMLIGTALFAIYTGLFAQAILEDELFRFKSKNKEKNKDRFKERS